MTSARLHKGTFLLVGIIALALSGCARQDPEDLRRGPSQTKSAGSSCEGSQEECEKKGQDQKKKKNKKKKDKGKDTNLTEVKPLSNEEAVAFIKERCGSCHNTEDGKVRSFWPLEVESFNKDSLATDSQGGTVYYSLKMKARGIEVGTPKAMPPGPVDKKGEEKIRRLLKWIEVQLPTVAQSGNQRYASGSGEDGSGTGVILDFQCEQPVTFRKYINRVTNDAFDRPPKPDEIMLTSHEPDEPTTEKDRKLVAKRLFENETWRKEFMEAGLKKFAYKVGGAGEIEELNGVISSEQAQDLRDEFYQLVKKNFESMSFKEMLLTDKVMVSPRTAELYEGCDAPSEGWTECTMQDPRGSYFSTVGFLRSEPSSFLVANNNYTRAAMMHFVISGDLFQAAFDEDEGGEETDPLPECLNSEDWRVEKVGADNTAPFGSSAIPASGNLCQSCHIDRQMAAGAMLFRPYDEAGRIYDPFKLMDDPNFDQATADNIVSKTKDGTETPVDLAYLQNLLLSDEEQACIPADDAEGDQPKELKNLDDLAKYLIGDGNILSSGLARHLPRSMSNLLNTSEEIIVRVRDAYKDGGGELAPLFKAYFSSETYACSNRGGGS